MKQSYMDHVGGEGAKKHAPAAMRNREAIAGVLERELPQTGTVLEIASGSGEHAAYFAQRFSGLVWQPSDPDPEALASIAAYRAEYPGNNLLPPLKLDAAAPESWPEIGADSGGASVVCINMVHISPWEASEGLFAGASRVVGDSDQPLVLYGPYFERDRAAATSNIEFDANLRARDPRWGLRYVEDMDRLGEASGFRRTARHEMPANNLTLVYCRA